MENKFSPGQTLGHYQIERFLGEGAMGAVYAATNPQIGKRVAIKTLRSPFNQDPDIVARFLNEARAVNVINYHGITQIFESGVSSEGYVYLVMELLEGEPLENRMARLGPMSTHDVLQIARQLAFTLSVVHKHKIVHRDLKPGNIFLVPDLENPGKDRTKILDFGIAKLSQQHLSQFGSDVKTVAGQLMGTPAYMSPEQCKGEPTITDKADIYSLGCIIFEMLTARPIFDALSVHQMLLFQIERVPPRISALLPTIGPEIDELLQKMLAKSQTERPSASQVVDRIDRIIASFIQQRQPVTSSVPAQPLSQTVNVPRKTVAHRGKITMIVFALLLSGVMIISIQKFLSKSHTQAISPARRITNDVPTQQQPTIVQTTQQIALPNCEELQAMLAGWFPGWRVYGCSAHPPGGNALVLTSPNNQCDTVYQEATQHGQQQGWRKLDDVFNRNTRTVRLVNNGVLFSFECNAARSGHIVVIRESLFRL